MSTTSTTNLPHILLIGATGRTGRLVLDSALQRGHKVTALIRPTSTLTPQSNLSIHTGSPTSHTDISNALSNIPGPIVIISALGQTRTSGNPFAAATSPPNFMTASVSAVISAMKTLSNVRKVVLMSMFGTGSSFSNLNFLMRWIMLHSNMLLAYEDHNGVDAVLKKSGVRFVAPRAVMLKGEMAAPIRFLGESGEGAGFMPAISAKSVAELMLDAAVSDEWDGRTDVIAN